MFHGSSTTRMLSVSVNVDSVTTYKNTNNDVKNAGKEALTILLLYNVYCHIWYGWLFN